MIFKQPDRLQSYSYHAAFLALFVVAVGMVFFKAIDDANFGGDTAGYILPFHNLLHGFGYVRIPGDPVETHVPPGFGLLALPFYYLVGDIELSANLVPAICFALTLLVVYRQTAKLWSLPQALMAALFLSAFPAFLMSGRSALTESPFILFLFIGFFGFTHILRDNRCSYALGVFLGFVYGFNFLIRPETIFVGMATYAVCALWPLFQNRKVPLAQRVQASLRDYYLPLLASLLAVACCLVPYGLFLESQLGYFTLTGKAGPSISWILGLDMGYEAPSDSNMTGIEGFLHFFIVDNGQVFLANLLKNYWTAFNKFAVDLSAPLKIVLLLAFAVSLLSWKRLFETRNWTRQHVAVALLTAAAMLPLLPLNMLFVFDRYLMPYQCIFLVVLAWVSLGLLERLSQILNRSLNSGPLILLAVALLFTANFTRYHDFAAKPHVHSGLRAAGIWLRDNVQGIAPNQVMTAGRGSPVYIRLIGGRPPTGPGSIRQVRPKWPLPEVAQRMQENESDYLVLAADHIDNFANLIPLWNAPEQASSISMKLLFKDPRDRFKIFRRIEPVGKAATP